jgi:hypothetical protein
MTWLLNEDLALKVKLGGITVADATAPNGGRKVEVLYRLPEVELASLQYPCIIIEHAGILPAPDREHRGYIQIPYAPEGYAPWWDYKAANPVFDPNDSPYYSWYPIPYNFNYQITVYARKASQHMDAIIAKLATYNYIPYHFGYLDIPQDGTKRTMVLEGGPEMGYTHDGDGKRLMTTTYLVTVFSELLIAPVDFAGPPVTDIEIDLSCYVNPGEITPTEASKQVGILSAGADISWGVGYINAMAASNAGLTDSSDGTLTT